MSERCVVIFTKPPKTGRVKTRLIGELSGEQAAQLHEGFLLDLLDRLTVGSFHLELAWALEPGETAPQLGLPGVVQQGDDLGRRLFHGLSTAFKKYQFVVVVGSDHPELPVERLEEAFSRLKAGADVVFGPAEDGGYYLIGTHRGVLHPRLFEEIPWSTDAVLATSLERCVELGLRTDLLALGTDVDTPADLRRLAASLHGRPEMCPRTYNLLERWGRLPAEQTHP